MRLVSTIELCKELHNDNYYNNLDFNKSKICSSCKQKLKLLDFSKHRKQPDGFTYECKNCILFKKKTKGINLAFHKSRSKKKGMEFNITNEDLFLPEYCPILNIKLDYAGKLKDHSPSVDRIDNSKGYVKGNVIVISYLANAMKNKASFEQLRNFSININKLINYYEMQGALGDVTDVFPNIKKRSLDL